MTIAAIRNNDGETDMGVDTNILPWQNGTVVWVAANTTCKAFSVRGFRGIGVAIPPVTAMAGATALKLMVATTEGGQYVQSGVDIPLHATDWTMFITTDVAFFNFAKFEIVGTLTGAAEMPYNRT